jgi:hypothetical protein
MWLVLLVQALLHDSHGYNEKFQSSLLFHCLDVVTVHFPDHNFVLGRFTNMESFILCSAWTDSVLSNTFHRLCRQQNFFYAPAVTSSRATEWYPLLHKIVVTKYNLGPSTSFCYFYFNIHMFSLYSSPHSTVINQHYNQLHHGCKLWFVLIFCIFSLKNQWPWNSPSWWKRVSQGLRFSQQCCWIFRSPDMLNRVSWWIFTDVWKL